jgi:hypothetical protein
MNTTKALILTRKAHEVPRRFWGNVYIFGKYSSRQVQRYISLLPQLRSKVKNRGGQLLAKIQFFTFCAHTMVYLNFVRETESNDTQHDPVRSKNAVWRKHWIVKEVWTMNEVIKWLLTGMVLTRSCWVLFDSASSAEFRYTIVLALTQVLRAQKVKNWILAKSWPPRFLTFDLNWGSNDIYRWTCLDEYFPKIYTFPQNRRGTSWASLLVNIEKALFQLNNIYEYLTKIDCQEVYYNFFVFWFKRLNKICILLKKWYKIYLHSLNYVYV